MNQPTRRRAQRILHQAANTVKHAPVQQTPLPPPIPQHQPLRRSRCLQGLPPTPPPPSPPPRARAPACFPAPSPSPQSPLSPTPSPVPWPIPLHLPYHPRTHIQRARRQNFNINRLTYRADIEITHDPMAELANFNGNSSRFPPRRCPQPSVEQGYRFHLL